MAGSIFVKKKLLLLPTTDHTVMGFSRSYEGMVDEYDIYFMVDGINIRNQHHIPWARMVPVACVRKFSSWPSLVKLFYFLVNTYYLRAKLGEAFAQIEFDAVVVSNDCPVLQDYAIQFARKKSIPVITHQLASGIVPNSNKISLSKMFVRKLFDVVCRKGGCFGFGGKSDYVFVMGDLWRTVVSKNVEASNIYTVSNGFYYYFRNDFLERTKSISKNAILRELGLKTEKKYIIFYSQPFYEIGLFGRADTLKIYSTINDLADELGEGWQLLFKPHPQEKLFKESSFNDGVNILLDSTPDECLVISDASLSVSSTMSLQSKLLGIPSYYLDTGLVPKHYREQSSYFFHKSLSEMNPADEFDEVVDMGSSIYIGEPPSETMKKLFRNIFDEWSS